jgi:hypothetical protein
MKAYSRHVTTYRSIDQFVSSARYYIASCISDGRIGVILTLDCDQNSSPSEEHMARITSLVSDLALVEWFTCGPVRVLKLSVKYTQEEDGSLRETQLS